ncbi:MAG: hypothetical protein WDM96_06680 [Lacunisphaera sp.]
MVWRDKPDGTLLAFDYTMARYGALLATAGADMFKNKEQVRFRAVAVDGSDAGIPLSRVQEVEARWEFSPRRVESAPRLLRPISAAFCGW